MTDSMKAPKFPIDGTLIEEPSSNPNFIIHVLIGAIMDISPDGLPNDDSRLLVEAARMERAYTVGEFSSVDLNDRREEVVFMIDRLIDLYNRLAATVPHATSITLVVSHPMGRNIWFTRDAS